MYTDSCLTTNVVHRTLGAKQRGVAWGEMLASHCKQVWLQQIGQFSGTAQSVRNIGATQAEYLLVAPVGRSLEHVWKC